MILFIVSALIAAVSLGLSIKFTVDYIRKTIPPIPFKGLLKRGLILGGVYTLGFASMMLSIYLWAKINPKWYEWLFTIFGGLLVGATSYISLFSFLFHYYGKGKDISEKLDKRLFTSLVISFPTLIVSIIYVLSEGFAKHVKYPLPNGIGFSSGFVTPVDGTPNIAFYALCILSGALYVYFLCDHKYYNEYGKHGILESTFLVAFPSGVLGARIFYVVGNWAKEFNYGNSFTELNGMKIWSPLAIWEGGLTILGGAITGIIIGAAWFMWRNKGYNIWITFDTAVPAILIAQAVGRWGNFFNCEVYGWQVPYASMWWIPTFIKENAHFGTYGQAAATGYIYVPLFYIECLTNLLGYFVLAHLFGHKLRKYTELGDLGFGYIIWYGFTRVFMEPYRNPEFNMGKDGYWSWIWALMFVLLGSLAIAVNHFIRYLRKPKEFNKKLYFFGSIGVGSISLILLVTSIILMATSSFKKALVLNQFNWGLIVLTISISILFMLLITLPPLILKRKENNSVNE